MPWIAQIREKSEQFEQGASRLRSGSNGIRHLNCVNRCADTPQYRHGYWRSIYSTEEYSRNFTAPTETHYKRALPTTEDLVVDRVFSKSYITALSDAERETLGKEIRDVVRRGEGKTWIDKDQGTFEYDYKTDLVLAQRK